VSTRLAAHEICLASCLSVKADVKMLKPRQTKPSQPPWYFFYFLFFQVSSSPEPWHHFSSDYERLWIAPTAAEQGLTKWFQQKTYYFSVLVSPSPPQFFFFFVNMQIPCGIGGKTTEERAPTSSGVQWQDTNTNTNMDSESKSKSYRNRNWT